MKKEVKSIIGRLFGGKMKKQPETTPIILTSYSQPHVLQQRMKEAKLTHGETVRGNVGPVRLESLFGKMCLYFCAAQEFQVTACITPGDGGSLPAEATLDGFEKLIPKDTKPGLYMLNNAKFFSNGTMQVIADEQTVFEAI